MSTKPDEFAGILIDTSGPRRPMSMPPSYKAARVFVDRVMHELNITDRERAETAADWIVNLMERYGARSALPVFSLEGEGPCCSWCGMIWPLCGHHHMSAEIQDEGDEEDTHE